MTLSKWIAILYICAYISTSESGIQLLYGSSYTIYCGESNPSTQPGDWYHDDRSLNVHNRSYTITNATFDDDGKYQCRINGRNVLHSPLQVDVYGRLYITPVNCTSIFDRVCVKNIKRGQSVSLCISHTTTPSIIPQGKHVTEYHHGWSVISIGPDGKFTQGSNPINNFNDSCYTLNGLQTSTDAGVIFHANIHPKDDMIVRRNEFLQYPFRSFFSDEDHHDIEIIFYVTAGGMRWFYGRTWTIYCGDSDPNTPPGEWFLNGKSLGVNTSSYTVTNATFDDDGEYQCKRNGSDVFSSPLQVDVYGLSHLNPLHCTSLSDGVCVKSVERGQPVTLCASNTTTPSTIPHGKHVMDVYRSEWLIRERDNISHISNESDVLQSYHKQTSDFKTLYVCSNGSCQWSNSSIENYMDYLNVSNNCLTINGVQKNKFYRLAVVFNDRNGINFVPAYVDFYLTNNKEIQVPFGGTLTLYCGDSDLTISPGNWYHDGEPLGVYSRIYTIRNATFDDDGKYQCIVNGSGALSSPFQVDVYGLLNITTLNCTSKLNDGTCVTSAQRGQPVTLCIGQFTTPSTIPQGNHQNVIGVDKSYWSISHFPLYKCQNGYCEEWPNNSLVNYSNFLNVSDSCLTVNNIGEGLGTAVVVGSATLLYGLRVYFDASGAIQLPSRIEKFSVEPYKEIRLGYGQTRTIYCGNSGHNTRPGDWLHDDKLLGVYSSSYTIFNATFDDDGKYQCRRNGSNVFLSFLEVHVYGTILNILPLNCNSMSQGACVRYVKRGQPVTLCTTITTIPAVIPPGKHVVSIHYPVYLLRCLKRFSDYCIYSTYVSNTHYSDSCVTINNVTEKEMNQYLIQNPLITTEDRILQDGLGFSIQFILREQMPTPHDTPSATPTPEVLIAFTVSIITIGVVIIFTSLSIVFATIVKRYKQTIMSSELDIPLQELYSSRPTNLTVYRIKDVKKLEKIGRGSFWKVHRGKLLDNRCAIKRLRGIKKCTNREGLIQKVLKELDMWSSLNHPNIVRLYGIYHQDDDDNGIPFLIMELMDRNLTDQLNATSDPVSSNSLLPLQTKLAILIQVAGALEYLHTHKNVVHGDLTANNVLLKESPTGSFTAKLSDFGMSRVLNEQDNIMSTNQGTYSYMPPEVHNAGQASTKVDIYSFGVLCVHILCHKFPKPLYALTVDPAGAHIIVSEFKRYRPYLLEMTDDEMLLEPLIEECLQYEPEERLRPEEVIGQLNSIQGRLQLKETGPAEDTQPSTVVHQHFIGPVVSGCTITESNLNVTSIADSNMQVSTAAEITPLTGPFEPVPAITSRADLPDTYHQQTA